MKLGRILSEVNPMGGSEKAAAIEEIAKKNAADISDVMYVGDSITDAETFKTVRNAGGLTVSFNGNRYAISEAEIAVISYHTIAVSILADIFNRFGKQAATCLAKDWNYRSIRSNCNQVIVEELNNISQQDIVMVRNITHDNEDMLIEESIRVRKTLRGESIANLG